MSGDSHEVAKAEMCVRACMCVYMYCTCTSTHAHTCVAHRCNVWDVWVEHCPSVMYKEDVKEGKGFHLHVWTGRLVTEADKGTTGVGERSGNTKRERERIDY